MELKQEGLRVRQSADEILLIVPYGIETGYKAGGVTAESLF